MVVADGGEEGEGVGEADAGDMTDNHRTLGIEALTCRVTIGFGRDLRKLLILWASRPSVQILRPGPL